MIRETKMYDLALVKNPKIPVKLECYDCRYLSPAGTGWYKCRVPGSCPAVAVTPQKKK